MTEREALQRYVLGTMDESERAELEQQYFADDEVFEELLDVEHDLIDAYVDGTLTPAERGLLEARFLSTAVGRERVAFARTLRRRMTSKRGAARQRLWLAAAASFMLVAVATAWVIVAPRQSDERPQVASQPTAVQTARKSVPAPPAAQDAPAPVAAETALITLALAPGGTRGGEAAPPLVLRNAPQWVQLDLLLEHDRYDSYTAELQDVDGGILWSASSLRAEDGAVKAKVPAKLLPPGDYVVVLSGVRGGGPVEIHDYTFTVSAHASAK